MFDNLYIRLFIAKSVEIRPEEWKLRNIQSSFWRLYFNDKPGAVIEFDGANEFPLEAEKLYFVPQGVRFNGRVAANLNHFYIHFDVTGLSSLAMRAFFNRAICLSPAPALEETTRELRQAVLAGHPADNLIIQCRLKAVIYNGLALFFERLPPEQYGAYLKLADNLKPVLPAIAYIDANLASPILNSQLAGLCRMNEDYFIRRFREYLGQTPNQYIQEQRVKLAAQQLLFTDDTIEQIASQTGFANRFYFSRVFARHTGLSPVAYRKTPGLP